MPGPGLGAFCVRTDFSGPSELRIVVIHYCHHTPHLPTAQRTLWLRAVTQPAQELTARKRQRRIRTLGAAHNLPHNTTGPLNSLQRILSTALDLGVAPYGPDISCSTSLSSPPEGDLERNGAKQLLPQWMESARKAQPLGHILAQPSIWCELRWGIRALTIHKSKGLRSSKPEVGLRVLFCGMISFSRWRHWGLSAHDFHTDISSNVAAKWELKPWSPETPGCLHPGPASLCGKRWSPRAAQPQGGLSRATASKGARRQV